VLIDLKHELKNYPAIDIASLEKNRPDLPDNFKNSVVLYNKALESIRSGSEDIAIIELKKAVSINPEFYEAANLLGLCYVSIKEYAKAEEMFKRVMDSENNGVKALTYIKALEEGNIPGASGSKKNSKKRYPFNRPAERNQNTGKSLQNSTSLKKEILKYAIGCLIGILVMVAINLLTSDTPQDSVQTSADADTTQIEEAVEAVKKEYEAKLNEMKQRNDVLEESLRKANQSIDYYKSVNDLLEAEKLATSGEYEKAADLLILLKPIDFQSTAKEKSDKLIQEIMPKAAREAYNQGLKLFKQKNYQEALDVLYKAKLYGSGLNNVNMDAILYNLAKIYMELGDYPNAISTFNEVINNYPNSGDVKHAKSWIAYIESNQ